MWTRREVGVHALSFRLRFLVGMGKGKKRLAAAEKRHGLTVVGRIVYRR